ncbi:MAG: MotA/TolQ/ExbB proton channel family protein [Bernardetiaceae bacterium]|nr:MotA/TolQ/ExbB proton channel family protein [Bernardetiaceae bacterium]
MDLFFLVSRYGIYILLICWFIYSLLLLYKTQNSKDKINLYIFESIPSVFITLGILGTFLGITYGLLTFDTDPEKISDSIKILLDGLKIAFLSSIIGLLFSLIFGQIVKWKLNTKLRSSSEETNALNTIIERLDSIKGTNESIKESNEKVISTLNEFTSSLSTSNQNAFDAAMSGVIDKLNQSIGKLVDKNFEKLDLSIANLNKSQEANKSNMDKLQKEFNKTSGNMEQSAEKLSSIAASTKQLVADEGKLKEILIALNQVLVEKNDFATISNNLANAAKNIAALTPPLKEATQKYSNTEQYINNWLNREKGIRESMILFLDKIQQFEAVDVKSLDSSFNNRLATTLQSFDKLFRQYVELLEAKNKR